MTSPAAPAAGRPRRWWLAFLLNLICPPAGYAYAGAWMAVGVMILVAVTGPMLVLELTQAHPPGFYVLDFDGFLALGAAICLGLAAHAAFVAARAPPKTGSRLGHAALYAAAWLLALGVNVALGAWWPNPAYTISSGAMEPTLHAGDTVLVDGARGQCGHKALKAGQAVIYRRAGVAYVARIVAGPGQAVEMKGGLLVVDGAPVGHRLLGSSPVQAPFGRVRATEVEETLANGARYRIQDFGPGAALDDVAPALVPAGSWYLMGDNRDNAMDSRVTGPVAGRDICAVAQKVLQSKVKARVGAIL